MPLKAIKEEVETKKERKRGGKGESEEKQNKGMVGNNVKQGARKMEKLSTMEHYTIYTPEISTRGYGLQPYFISPNLYLFQVLYGIPTLYFTVIFSWFYILYSYIPRSGYLALYILYVNPSVQVMAGIIAIYGVVVAVLIAGELDASPKYTLYKGYPFFSFVLILPLAFLFLFFKLQIQKWKLILADRSSQTLHHMSA